MTVQFSIFFSFFLETGVMRNKIKKSSCSSLLFQGRMYWGAAELDAHMPKPSQGIATDRAAA